MNSTSLLRSVSLLAFAVSLSACSGKGGVVTGATLKAFTQGSDQYGELSIGLDTGSLNLPIVELPILNPQSGLAIGQVGIQSALKPGQEALVVDLDFSTLLRLPTGGSALLPNGDPLPIAGVDASKLITLPLGGSGSRAYLSLDIPNKNALLGVALVIPQFKLGVPLELFYPFGFGGVSGAAGVFTGAGSGQSGFAVFADVSAVLSAAAQPQFAVASVSSAKAKSLPVKAQIVPLQSNGSKAIETMLLNLNARHTQLTIR